MNRPGSDVPEWYALRSGLRIIRPMTMTAADLLGAIECYDSADQPSLAGSRDGDGVMPLHSAAAGAHGDVVGELLAAGPETLAGRLSR